MAHVPIVRRAAALLVLSTLPFSLARAQDEAAAAPVAEGEEATGTPILDALSSVSADVRVYNDHLTTLASPFMEGRVPGSRGMEIAKEYMEHYFVQHGLSAPFADGTSYRQPFPLAGTAKLESQALSFEGIDLNVSAEEDYTAMSVGGGASVSGPAVFVGYSIKKGEDDYTNYPEGMDLTGKVAVMFRFEPMDAEGKSLWASRGWSNRASFNSKIRAVRDAGAIGAVIVNTPGADDPRVDNLIGFNSGGRKVLDGPVFMLTTEAGTRLLEAADPEGRSVDELRGIADEEGGAFDLNVRVNLSAEIDDQELTAENVGGLIEGKGELKDELVVIGAHLDHLGMGYFGSRSGAGELHPGADDNASGSAALIMLADKLQDDYAALPEDADARSILILAFSAEESGLNGSFYYAANPIRPIEDHALMINFDMIGRILNDRLSVSGGVTGEGMSEWLAPYFEESPLSIVEPEGVSGASDHTAFMRKDVPILFAIIADFHGDYHTPGDTSDKINRVGAVHTVHLFQKIAFGAATRAERFAYKEPPRRNRRAVAAAATPELKVRVGLLPSFGEGQGLGVRVGTVTPETAAAEAGIEPGDMIVRWDGVKVEDLESWSAMLAEHEPGDEVKVGIKRDGEELTLDVKLRAR